MNLGRGVAFFAFSFLLGAQADRSVEPKASPSVTDELRLIRSDLRTFFRLNIRTQIVFERINIEQQIVDRLKSDREAVFVQQSESAMLAKQQAEVVASLERRLASESSQDQRIDIEREIKIAALSLESTRVREQRAADRLGGVARELEAAESRLASARNELRSLEKTLDDFDARMR